MSQDRLIKLQSKTGDENGVGKGHMIRTFRNKKAAAAQQKGKLSLMKYNPVARKHTLYEETK